MKSPFAILSLMLASTCLSNESSLSETLAAFCESHQLPGAAAAYRFNGSHSGVVCYGLEDSARMLAGSVGKTFVAAAVLRLAMQGCIALDEPVVSYFAEDPWYPRLPNADTITIRHLLTHSGGLPDHVHDPRFAAALSQRWKENDPISPVEQLAFVLDQSALFKAGEGWAYSDSGYVLLGLLVEKVTYEPILGHVRRTLLQPLGLHATAPAVHREIPNLAQGHVTQPNAYGFPSLTLDPTGKLQWHPGVEGAGGGLVSTVEDLTRWGELLYGGSLLGAKGMAELVDSVPICPETQFPAYGAGVVIDTHPSAGRSLGHRGWIPGYVTSLQYFPEHGLTLAIQMNSDQDAGNGHPPLLRQLENQLIQSLLAEKGL